MITICCIKWGDKYGPEYVNKLCSMTERHVHKDYDFVCFTENPEGIGPHIRTAPLLCDYPGWWQKIGLFQEKIPGVYTDKIFFLDLDMVIVDSIDPILEMDSDFALLRDWPPEVKPDDNSFGSGAFLLRVGSQVQVWKKFSPKVMTTLHGDQDWINAEAIGGETFPYGWTPSYKLRNLQDAIPEGAKIVVFHGEPRPHQCGGWVKDYWK